MEIKTINIFIWIEFVIQVPASGVVVGAGAGVVVADGLSVGFATGDAITSTLFSENCKNP